MAYRIRDVWADNLEEEMEVIRGIIDDYPFVAMDTEFPGVVARPIGNFRSSAEYHYQTLRCNVDLLRIIQLGLTFSDEKGSMAQVGGRDGQEGVTCCWQFNFRFSLNEDMYATESIDLLTKSGINFKRHEDYGVDVEQFGELIISSGLVLLDNVKWISFHSGYDFGYLLKVVSCAPLPPKESEFFELLRIWFPCIYDIKHLMKSCKSLKGGLQDVADELQVARIGPQHQAGSDSLLTASTFFKMRSRFFEDSIDSKYMGYLYGLGSTHHSSSSVSSSIIPAPSIIPPHLRERDTGTITPTLPLFPPTPSAAIPIQNPREREKREAAAAAAAAAALLASSVESAKDPLTLASEKEARENGDGTSTEDSASPVMRSASVAGER